MDLQEIIKLSLQEDIGSGDVTTKYLDLGFSTGTAFLIAKEDGILAGLDIFFSIFKYLDKQCQCIAYKKDGEQVAKGEEIAKVKGFNAALLQAERTALNFAQRLSGIATLTYKLTQQIKPHAAKLLDTRKTTPLLRELEKYAVTVGGGYNHRFGLYDMVMLKENHIRSAGSITNAVNKIKQNNTAYKIEVEVTNLPEAKEAVACQADRMMLDNMSLADMTKAVELYADKIEIEASGNVTLQNINQVAACGVHYISTGSVTHSYKSLDLSLVFKE